MSLELDANNPAVSVTDMPNASRGKRFAAMMYEGVLLFGVVFTADYLFDTLTQSKHALMFRPGRQFWLFLAIGAYFLLCWHRGGQTLPMRAWHIKLVGANGQRPSLKQLLVRYLLMWPVPLVGMALIYALVSVTGWPAIYTFAIVTPFLVFIPSWFAADGQFLHDRLAGTRIVDIPEHLRHAAKHKK
ncbi:MAG: RDD family protein [Burkholderiaceae bacterium]|nr:RDD family protein [Burkholderiaceae bacterium]MCD8517601.1 RDD family protein [Burkholderiaceae bacterium]MCD8537395.1 RDD family protein [Burkholderiaceae bacterium]MCD8565553.1 RDD family protein [Burkholderiaceae bacterium]